MQDAVDAADAAFGDLAHVVEIAMVGPGVKGAIDVPRKPSNWRIPR